MDICLDDYRDFSIPVDEAFGQTVRRLQLRDRCSYDLACTRALALRAAKPRTPASPTPPKGKLVTVHLQGDQPITRTYIVPAEQPAPPTPPPDPDEAHFCRECALHDAAAAIAAADRALTPPAAPSKNDKIIETATEEAYYQAALGTRPERARTNVAARLMRDHGLAREHARRFASQVLERVR